MPRLRPIWVYAVPILLLAVGVSTGRTDDVGARLLRAYPQALAAVEGNQLIWRDGTRMALDDGIHGKDFKVLLDRPDIEDQFAYRYPMGRDYPIPARNQDPGRIRNAAFFRKMYGASESEVRRRLVPVRWLSANLSGRGQRTVYVTATNGVNRRLEEVVRELDALPPALKRYVDRPAGTFNWRVVAGTERPSAHSFGIAIDINTANADYWHWTGKPEGSPDIAYRNRIPLEIVEIFERHGFIWGGKWYHYDTMHFEYRPELLEAQSTDQGSP
jgi:peptidoglycan L-alanyl-D-glutamate endopeptidase CwlK